MNDTPRATLEKLNDKGNGLRVEFFWLGDRLGHTISSVKEGVAITQWRSVGDDPLGPVYQELHEQESDAGKIVFLNGSGHGAHWSASVEFETLKCVVAFDVAARVGQAPSKRVVEYRGAFESTPPVLFGNVVGVGECKSEDNLSLIQFYSTTPGPQLPTTVRFKYVFIG
jgi:hypothetical protein